MKKIILLIIFALNFSFSQNDGNYILIVGKDSIYFDLNKQFEINLKNSEKNKVKIIQSEYQTYSDEMVRFKYHRSLGVSNSIVDEGIEQCLVANSTGTGFLIQKFKSLNPESFTSFMLQEITKESVNYGYKKIEIPFYRKLKSGHKVEGIKATLTYKDEKEEYTVFSFGKKDEGLIFVTMKMYDSNVDNDIINTFLDSLEILN